jgi:cytochrome c oxidase assembly protein Cox11
MLLNAGGFLLPYHDAGVHAKPILFVINRDFISALEHIRKVLLVFSFYDLDLKRQFF